MEIALAIDCQEIDAPPEVSDNLTANLEQVAQAENVDAPRECPPAAPHWQCRSSEPAQPTHRPRATVRISPASARC
jgi:hypothetical protein